MHAEDEIAVFGLLGVVYAGSADGGDGDDAAVAEYPVSVVLIEHSVAVEIGRRLRDEGHEHILRPFAF